MMTTVCETTHNFANDPRIAVWTKQKQGRANIWMVGMGDQELALNEGDEAVFTVLLLNPHRNIAKQILLVRRAIRPEEAMG